jgi:methylated-DNA-[protein]-cysteine S-methyltransferase
VTSNTPTTTVQAGQITTTHAVLDSPLGVLTVVADHGAVVGLYFAHHPYAPARERFGARHDDGFKDVRRQLGEYFAGERQEFDLPLALRGDEVQQRVWDLVRHVPYGQTSTYGQLARALADGTTAQDVGAAVGRNPLCILVPCHRIVGHGGRLTGYAGGLPRKQALLDLEDRNSGAPRRLF